MSVTYGFDIGTSKICLLVVDESGKCLNKFYAPNCFTKDKEQDADVIVEKCFELKKRADGMYGKCDCIGVTNQMHGILYVDKNGQAVSPLFTWQDEKGNAIYKKSTYAKVLSDISGYKCGSGYGCVTHYYLTVTKQILANAVKFCTIGDYLLLKLFGFKKPIIHPTNAASLGLYDIRADKFDFDAAEKAGLNIDYFPELGDKFNNSVKTAIGDNQASMLGLLSDPLNSVFINVGTGSQVSVVTDKYCASTGEIRPYFDGKRILVGAAITGGYALKILSDFFDSVIRFTCAKPDKPAIEYFATLSRDGTTDMKFETAFRGSRENKDKKASIVNISQDNFTAEDMVYACEKGIIDELHQMYVEFSEKRDIVVVSGNGIKKNPYMLKYSEQIFGTKIKLTDIDEEAAYGAAIWGRI